MLLEVSAEPMPATPKDRQALRPLILRQLEEAMSEGGRTPVSPKPDSFHRGAGSVSRRNISRCRTPFEASTCFP